MADQTKPMDAEREYVVKFVTLEEWREAHQRGEWTAQATLDRLANGGQVLMCVTDNTINWECPGCGCKYVGTRGPEPVSGWDAPRWLVTGPENSLSATPSLGCPRWQAGQCVGHWWLREGRLVRA